MKKTRKALLLAAVAISLAALTLCFFGRAFVRRGEGGVLAGLKRLALLAKKGPVSRLRVSLGRADRDITFTRSDGIVLAGSIFGERPQSGRHGVILVHGHTRLGRRLAMYQILGSGLAEKGYAVLTFDRAGYGESEDPFKIGAPEALSYDLDANAALDYMIAETGLDFARIDVIGHSGGSPAAIRMGMTRAEIGKIVVIGPPRRIAERMIDPEDREFLWKRVLSIRSQGGRKQVPQWFTETLWAEQTLTHSNMDTFLSHFSNPDHKPTLFIDGELEHKEDKIYLANYYNRISTPKRYVTIQNADHYANTVNAFGLEFYDEAAVKSVISSIDDFLSQNYND